MGVFGAKVSALAQGWLKTKKRLFEGRILGLCEQNELLDGDALNGIELFFLKSDSKDAVFEIGTNRIFIFFNLDR